MTQFSNIEETREELEARLLRTHGPGYARRLSEADYREAKARLTRPTPPAAPTFAKSAREMTDAEWQSARVTVGASRRHW